MASAHSISSLRPSRFCHAFPDVRSCFAEISFQIPPFTSHWISGQRTSMPKDSTCWRWLSRMLRQRNFPSNFLLNAGRLRRRSRAAPPFLTMAALETRSRIARPFIVFGGLLLIFCCSVIRILTIVLTLEYDIVNQAEDRLLDV